MAERDLLVFDSVEGLQAAAAERAAQLLRGLTGARSTRIALSGGSTPRRFHELLARVDGIDWSRVHVYWGDERAVGPDDPESNYRMARETLLDHVPIPPAQVHRMRGEEDPHQAAAGYERVLAETFGVQPPAVPRLDLVILGVGPDGHTASLFPGTAALAVRDRWVVANHVPQQQAWRITLTYAVLDAAGCTLVLAAGENKAEAIERIFVPGAADQPPAAFVRPAGPMLWFLDRAAASRLPNHLTGG
jgi:6-phosphogluconolactonase